MTGSLKIGITLRNERKQPNRPARVRYISKKAWWCCTLRKLFSGANDWTSRYPMTAMQWDTGKNGCAPEKVRSDSFRRYWWRCERGHSWQMTIRSRIGAQATGCPYCEGRQALPGDNDLQTLRPDLAAQWDDEKNFPLRADAVTPESSLPVFWRCRLGHSYLAEIRCRAEKNSGCPYCAGKKALAGFNDLKTLCPEIAAEWHPTRNGALKPTGVLRGSARRVWWQCARGHEWEDAVCSRTGAFQTGCPECARSAGMRDPGCI